jgi:hypothetical protein
VKTSGNARLYLTLAATLAGAVLLMGLLARPSSNMDAVRGAKWELDDSISAGRQ